MAIIPWGPWSELENVHRQLNRMFEEPGSDVDTAERGRWLPAVDIRETDDNLVVEAELPGIDKKDVKVEVENGVLTISGERRYEKDVKEENVHRVERSYGRFVRSFSLPSHVDESKVNAKMEDGVLRVTLPKSEQAKAKSITVE